MSSSAAAAAPRQKWWNGPVQGLQKVGRSLQLPVAVLPAAGLLVSLGNLFDSYLNGAFWEKTSKVLLNGGGAILDGELGLPLLFCIGVAIGFAKKADGSTALAAVVGFLVYRGVLTAFPIDGTVTDELPDGEPQNPGVLGGILIGLLTAVVWQRYHRTKLVDWLGFFNGSPTAGADPDGVPLRHPRHPVRAAVAAGGRRADLVLQAVDRPRFVGRGDLRLRQPAADPDRHAPVPEHVLLVPGGRVHRGGRQDGAGGTSPGSSPRTRRRASSPRASSRS